MCTTDRNSRESLRPGGWSNRLLEEETGIAVGRYHRRGSTRLQELLVYPELEVPNAPRVILFPNHGLVELGAYEINKLRRPARVSFYAWTPVSGIPVPQNKPNGPRYDRMKLAREYQSLLDSGAVKTRAELARFVGVSRARVTQVLQRLADNDS